MYQVFYYRDFGFTTHLVFATYNLAAAVKVMACLGNGEDWEKGYYILSENGEIL